MAKISDELRYEELYQRAVLRYLDKTDWDIDDWLSDKDSAELHKLAIKLGLEGGDYE